LVQLVPRSQLTEEDRIEERSRRRVQGKPEEVQAEFLEKLNQSKFLENQKNQKKASQTFWRTPFNDCGYIKSYDCDTETARHVPKARHVRLTIGKGLKSIPTVAGLVTMIALLLWAVMPIHRFYHRLAQPPSLQVDWIQPPSIVWVLTIMSLLVLSGLLLTLYYRLIGRNIGAKIDIRFRRAEHSANDDWTRYIVQTSLVKEEADEALKEKPHKGWLTEMIEGNRKAIREHKTKPEGEN
jgi:hypothetical protein